MSPSLSLTCRPSPQSSAAEIQGRQRPPLPRGGCLRSAQTGGEIPAAESLPCVKGGGICEANDGGIVGGHCPPGGPTRASAPETLSKIQKARPAPSERAGVLFRCAKFRWRTDGWCGRKRTFRRTPCSSNICGQMRCGRDSRGSRAGACPDRTGSRTG